MNYYANFNQDIAIMSALVRKACKSMLDKLIMHYNIDEKSGQQSVSKNDKELQMAQYHKFQWHAKDFSHCVRGHSISRCDSQMRCDHEQQITLYQYGIKQSRP